MAIVPQDASHDVQQSIQQLNQEIAALKKKIADGYSRAGEIDSNLVTQKQLAEALARPKHLDFRDVFRAAGPAHSIGYVPSDGRWMSGAMPQGHERVLREDAVWRMPQVQGPYVIGVDDPHQKNTLHGHLHVAGAVYASKLTSGGEDVFGDLRVSGGGDISGDLTVSGGADIAGDLLVGGEQTFSGPGLPSGSVWGNEIGWSQASAVQNTWYVISDSDMSDATAGLSSITHNGSGRMTVAFAGRYLCVYGVTFEVSVANHHIQTGIAINGSTISDGIQHRDATVANSGATNASTAILELAASQYVEIAIRTTDTGAPMLSVDHLSFSLVHIGGAI